MRAYEYSKNQLLNYLNSIKIYNVRCYKKHTIIITTLTVRIIIISLKSAQNYKK